MKAWQSAFGNGPADPLTKADDALRYESTARRKPVLFFSLRNWLSVYKLKFGLDVWKIRISYYLHGGIPYEEQDIRFGVDSAKCADDCVLGARLRGYPERYDQLELRVEQRFRKQQ
jgi:hypothetical protein